MGPQYHKNSQFLDLMKSGAATPVETESDILEWYEKYRGNKDLVEKLNKGIKLVKENGAYDRVLSEHLGSAK